MKLKRRPLHRRPPMKLVAPGRPGQAAPGRKEPTAADRAKQSFMAAITHELRTPLNAIIGFAEIMDGELLGPIETPQYREYIRDIRASGWHLLRFIEDILVISQAEAGQLVLGKREVELVELVDRAHAPFEAQCLLRRIRFVFDLPSDLVIRVDPARAERALSCLLSNAVKFSEDGGEIRVQAFLEASGTLRLVIRDHGIGMAPAAIERAFAPFVQLEDKLSRPYEGAGLGLPLARLLTELHGGRVTIDSRPGEGTAATLELPAY
jgi:signal transduction histidine kinase